MQTAREILLDVYQDLYGPQITLANLNELASDLSRVIGRSRPWTGKFLHSIIKQYAGFSTNASLTKALTILAARLDGLNEIQAQAQEMKGLLAINELPPGTVILGLARRCAAPGCPVRFVPTHPRQKYHSKACAALGRRHKQQPEAASQENLNEELSPVSMFQSGRHQKRLEYSN
ncbi:MAG: hypothetical protein KJ077_14635 [Anaerolineae bacterium]|nr:hypothetical protein [Anaerolineae bacterium]